MKRFLSILMLGMIITSCSKQPVAMFTTDETTYGTNETIQFHDQSEEAVKYYWDFGDGSTSSDPNPTHAYKEHGNYTVTLKVNNKGGKRDDFITKSIKIAKRKFNKFVLLKAPVENNWDDDGTGPDIAVVIGTDENYARVSTIALDVKPSAIPITLSFDPIEETTQEWSLEVVDIDDGGYNKMIWGTFKQDELKANPFKINTSLYEAELYWEY